MNNILSFTGRKGGKSGGGGDESPNTLRSKSIGRVLDLISEGPIQGLVDDKKGIYLNETPWQASNGEMNFEGISAEFRYGDAAQDPIPGFPSIEREVSVSSQVKKLISVTRTISDPLLHAVRITLSVQGLIHSSDDGDINGTSVDIAIDVKSFGGSFVEVVTDKISGKTNSVYERSYRIDLPEGGAPWDIRVRRITDDSEDLNLQNDTFWSRYTEIIDHKLIYPDSAYVGVNIDAQMFQEGVPERKYLIDGIKMNIPSNYFPLGMNTENAATWSENLADASWQKVQSTATSLEVINPNGEQSAFGIIPNVTSIAHSFRKTVTVLANQSTCQSVYVKKALSKGAVVIFVGLSNTACQATLTLDFDAKTINYTNSASMITNGGVTSNYGFEELPGGWFRIYWSGYVSSTETQISARVHPTDIASTATIFAGDGVNPYIYFWGYQVNKGISPHPYIKAEATPTTGITNKRYYYGQWNGQFKQEWCDSPAWTLYMLLTNKRFGLGQWVPETMVDKWQLYSLSQYCDELVPDGFGGMEPRFTFNGVIRDREEAYKVIQTIASAFRGIMYWGAGSTIISYDAPKDASILVTPANVIDGNFEYQGVGWKARHSVALVTWWDPNNLYKENVEAIEDQELIERFGWKPVETIAIGCTSRGQAYRWGKWILDTEKHETETVTYRASFDHMIKDGSAVMPGDVIKLQDPSYAGVRNGGRIQASYNSNAMTEYGKVYQPMFVLDDDIDWLNGDSYTISFVKPDGKIEERPISRYQNSYDIIQAELENLTATSSSMFDPASHANNALDTNAATVAKTSSGGSQWIDIDLGDDFTITSVVVTANSFEGSELNGARVSLLGANGELRKNLPLISGAANSSVHTLTTTNVDFVKKVRISNTNHSVAISRIEVMGFKNDFLDDKIVFIGGGDIDFLPVNDAMWVITSSNVAPRTFRVLSVKEAEPNIVEVVALFHDVNKYARVEEDIILETQNFSVVSVGPLNPPRNLMHKEYLYKTVGGSIASSVTISWESPANEARVLGYEVQIKEPGEDWKRHSFVYEQSVDIPNIKSNYYSFRVKAVSAIGSPSIWVYLNDVHIFGVSSRPGNVLGFNMMAIGDQAYLTWTPNSDMLISHYILKHQSNVSSPSWGSGIKLVQLVDAKSSHIYVPLLFGTYMIKAVSVAGVESDVAAMAIADIAGIMNFNAVQNIVCEPTFAGTKTNCSVVSNVLVVTASSPNQYPAEAIYELNGYYDLTEVYTNRITPKITAFGDRTSFTMNTWTNLTSVENLSGNVDNFWSVVLEYSSTKGNPAGSPVWTAWQPLLIGDSTARAYKFRIRLISEDPSIQVGVSNLSISIDMPDRTEGAQNLSIASGGTTVTYTKGFKEKPAVAITINGATTGDDIFLTSETKSGFTVQIKNAGVGVARTINWIAKGYGRVN